MKADIAIYQLLSSSGVDSIVDGVYLYIADEGATTPYISIFQTDMDVNHSKTSSSSIDVSDIVVQIVDTDRRNLKNIADAVRMALDGVSGDVVTADETINITRIHLYDFDSYFEMESSRQVYVNEFSFRVRERRTPDYTA